MAESSDVCPTKSFFSRAMEHVKFVAAGPAEVVGDGARAVWRIVVNNQGVQGRNGPPDLFKEVLKVVLFVISRNHHDGFHRSSSFTSGFGLHQMLLPRICANSGIRWKGTDTLRTGSAIWRILLSAILWLP